MGIGTMLVAYIGVMSFNVVTNDHGPSPSLQHIGLIQQAVFRQQYVKQLTKMVCRHLIVTHSPLTSRTK